MSRRSLARLIAVLLSINLAASACGQVSVSGATAAMERASTYFTERLSRHGGYVYFYSLDLSKRFGEGSASEDQIWVQPPGTPTVGNAFLDAFGATQDSRYLKAAKEAADALLYGQLKSGGWRNAIDFDPTGTQVDEYRNGKGHGKNYSTLDDGITQAALQFLIRLDETLRFQDANLHAAVGLGLDSLLSAQYPNGAFPQVWQGPSEPHPPQSTAYPTYDWRTEGRVKQYWLLYTLNDNVAGNVVATLRLAMATYDDPRYQRALAALGDFLIAAQMPQPQPAWAQQYRFDMIPAWARKFEPPAIASSESQDVIAALMTIYEATGQSRYLEPIPAALEYLSHSLLPSGEFARYYELQSNRPLYMQRDGDNYQLTYDDRDLPKHYGWKIESHLTSLTERYRSLQTAQASQSTAVPQEQVQQIVESLDSQGRWISTYDGQRLVGQPKFAIGQQYLSSEVFSRNLSVLADYVKQNR